MIIVPCTVAHKLDRLQGLEVTTAGLCVSPSAGIGSPFSQSTMLSHRTTCDSNLLRRTHFFELVRKCLIVGFMLPEDFILVTSCCALQQSISIIASHAQPNTIEVQLS